MKSKHAKIINLAWWHKWNMKTMSSQRIYEVYIRLSIDFLVKIFREKFWNENIYLQKYYGSGMIIKFYKNIYQNNQKYDESHEKRYTIMKIFYLPKSDHPQ